MDPFEVVEFIAKYGLGGVALWQLRKLRDDMRAGFASVTKALEQQDDRLDDHESRIRTLEDR